MTRIHLTKIKKFQWFPDGVEVGFPPTHPHFFSNNKNKICNIRRVRVFNSTQKIRSFFLSSFLSESRPGGYYSKSLPNLFFLNIFYSVMLLLVSWGWLVSWLSINVNGFMKNNGYSWIPLFLKDMHWDENSKMAGFYFGIFCPLRHCITH